MPLHKLKLVLLYGSVREGRLCDRVAEWVTAEVESDSIFEIKVVDPRAFLDPLVCGVPHDPALEGLRRTIADADGFLVITPEYNHSYPAALKLLIDAVYEQWQAKPVAFVSYGGASGGLRAVEHLRQVFAELHTVTVRDTVSFSNVWEQFGDQRELSETAHRSMAALLNRLRWWAAALRTARAASPYNQLPA
jgi:NAD(P)H-dependent FMN reductase